MIKLKNLVKESVLVTEGTRWLVGIEQPNGKIQSTYGHYDGYPQHTGKLLKKIYNKPAIVKQLMKLGKQGISFLDKSIKGGKDHSFDNRKDGETVFLTRIKINCISILKSTHRTSLFTSVSSIED